MPPSQRTYRIQAVAEATGLSAATLRAWERRYGIPTPQRTASSYRLYTDGNLAELRRMQQLCDEGMAPSEAAALIKAELDAQSDGAVSSLRDPTEIRTRMLDAIRAFAPERIEKVLQDVWNLGPASVVYDEVLAPVMQEVGELWARGALTIAQEHLVTHMVETSLRRALTLVQAAPSQPVALLACFPEDQHSLPLYGIALHAAAHGYRCVLLGQRTPASAVAQAVREFHPAWVGLSCTIAPEDAEVNALIEAYASACADTPWVVGGQGVANVRTGILAAGGHVLAPGSRSGLHTFFSEVVDVRRTG